VCFSAQRLCAIVEFILVYVWLAIASCCRRIAPSFCVRRLSRMSVQGSGDILSVHISPNMNKVSDEEDKEMESLASYDQIAAYAASVYAGLGSSYNENIYHQGLLQELHYFNISHETEKVIPVLYRRKQIGVVRADIIVQNNMVVELKCVAKVTSAHYEQALATHNCLASTTRFSSTFPPRQTLTCRFSHSCKMPGSQSSQCTPICNNNSPNIARLFAHTFWQFLNFVYFCISNEFLGGKHVFLAVCVVESSYFENLLDWQCE